jgi:predicted nucleic acid-binding protein
VYLDSSILVKLFVTESDSLFYAERAHRQAAVWSSQIALTECWSALCRKRREGHLDDDTLRDAWERLETRIQDQTLRLQPVTEPILRLANRMIAQCRERAAIRTLDAIHLATCEFRGAFPLQTADGVMRAAARALGIPLGPLPGTGDAETSRDVRP